MEKAFGNYFYELYWSSNDDDTEFDGSKKCQSNGGYATCFMGQGLDTDINNIPNEELKNHLMDWFNDITNYPDNYFDLDWQE